MKLFTAIGIAALSPTLALAEPLAFQDFLDQSNGVEVTLTGKIGIGGYDDKMVVLPSGSNQLYQTELALDRATVRSLEGCKVPMFGEGNCSASFKAELDFSSGRLHLLVFEISDLERTE